MKAAKDRHFPVKAAIFIIVVVVKRIKLRESAFPIISIQHQSPGTINGPILGPLLTYRAVFQPLLAVKVS